MKVLLIAPYFFEKHRWMISAYKTAFHLAKKHQVIVLTTGSPRYEILNENLRIYRMPDYFIPDPVNYSIVPTLPFSLLRILRKERPQACLVSKHMFGTSFAVFYLRLFGFPVATITDTFPGMNWHPRKWWVDLVMRIYAWCIGLPILRTSSKVVLLHEGLVPLAKRLKLRYQVIHNGVDLETYIQAKPANDLATQENIITITYIGRLESVKGFDDLLAVAKRMVESQDNIRFLFVGDSGRAKDYLDRYKHPRILFLGHRNDVPNILKSTDIFVLPSYAEGLPNALMEAMAAGVACVASNVGGVQILLKHQISGMLFTPGDQAILESILQDLIKNPEKRKLLGNAAFEVIKHGYDWRVILNQYNDLLTSIQKI
jgi:glycosyltransferase involved in cell wall biosynthesis